ncbi:MAG: bifunctional hydroxymethylpyrimidine kinase/phosphomethylpyrimidine kinase [Lentisphaeria bacterium]|nr:bifunctional hydroxymethylpyrimidine kinase/phosphomethylpyrimidine kinase [Lentisphaeria bacterium]
MSNKKPKSSRQFYPFALTVSANNAAGSSGIAADLRTFNAFGVYGSSVTTAVISCTPAGKTLRVDKLSAESVKTQLDMIVSVFSPSFIKCGMLPEPEMIDIVADIVKKQNIGLICDPEFSMSSIRDTYAEKLISCSAWILPDTVEAQKILNSNKEITTEKDLFYAAKELYNRFGTSVLLKGGKLDLPESVDAVCRGGKLYRLTSPLAEMPPCAGSGAGCTLSAGLTAGLVLDYPWKQALCEAKSFVLGSLTQNVELANGVFAMYPPTEDCYDLIKLEEKNL